MHKVVGCTCEPMQLPYVSQHRSSMLRCPSSASIGPLQWRNDVSLLCLLQRIYIALPEEKARAHMFKVHLGDTPHNLEAADYAELGKRTEGFSGSDVAVVVKDVLMEPVRQTQEAGFFRCAQLWLLWQQRNDVAVKLHVTSRIQMPTCDMLNTAQPQPRSLCRGCALLCSQHVVSRQVQPFEVCHWLHPAICPQRLVRWGFSCIAQS